MLAAGTVLEAADMGPVLAQSLPRGCWTVLAASPVVPQSPAEPALPVILPRPQLLML